MGGDDHGAAAPEFRQLLGADACVGPDAYAEVPGPGCHPVDEPRPAADRVAGLRGQGGGTAQPFLDEGGGERTGVVVEEGDAHVVGRRAGALLAHLGGGPAVEVGVDGRVVGAAAGEAQQSEGRGPAQCAVAVEEEAGAFEGRYGGEGAEEPAPFEPGPVGAAAVEGVRSFVGEVGAVRGPGASAERVVGLVEGDLCPGFGGGDGGGQSGEAAADDVDALHGWVSSRWALLT